MGARLLKRLALVDGSQVEVTYHIERLPAWAHKDLLAEKREALERDRGALAQVRDEGEDLRGYKFTWLDDGTGVFVDLGFDWPDV